MTITVTDLGPNSFKMLVPAGTTIEEVQQELDLKIVDFGWEPIDTLVYRSLCADGVTYKYMKLNTESSGLCQTEVFDNYYVDTHVGTHRAGPGTSLVGQYDDRMKTKFWLFNTSQQVEIFVYANPRWFLISSVYGANSRYGYHTNISLYKYVQNSQRYSGTIYNYDGVSGCVEIKLNPDVVCATPFMWIHTAHAVDDHNVEDDTEYSRYGFQGYTSPYQSLDGMMENKTARSVASIPVSSNGSNINAPLFLKGLGIRSIQNIRDERSNDYPRGLSGKRNVIDFIVSETASTSGSETPRILGTAYGLKIGGPQTALPSFNSTASMNVDADYMLGGQQASSFRYLKTYVYVSYTYQMYRYYWNYYSGGYYNWDTVASGTYQFNSVFYIPS